MIKLQQYGDSAILLNFPQKIDRSINQQVVTLAKEIEKAIILGFHYCIPAYCSLTVVFDLKKITYQEFAAKIEAIVANMETDLAKPISGKSAIRILNIPVCYDSEFALDLENLSKEKQLSNSEIIDLHSSTSYQVFMLGFLPGFPYLGILPNELTCQRKKTPRPKVAARSVGIAGQQTGIYPSDAPGGWQIIGKTPVDIFLPNAENPFLLQTGDQVNFRPITTIDFKKIENDIVSKTFNWQEVYA